MSIRTHYDNLRVAQNASAADIRQAYRRLSKQYHPDLNPSPDAQRIMQIINRAYEVLSDPQSRAEHDRWIAIQKSQQRTTVINITQSAPASTMPVVYVPPKNTHSVWLIVIIALLSILLVGASGCWLWLMRETKIRPHISPPSETVLTTHMFEPMFQHNTNAPSPTIAPNNNAYIRPHSAPNGNPWPDESAYLIGYPIITGQGKQRLYIDNARNSSDVYAELMREGQSQPLRHFFIKERSYWLLDQLDTGTYTIRYRQLDAGEELLSETIRINRKTPETTVFLQRGKAPQ